jgi:NarL family two-component system response regulator LiaR
MEIASLIRVMIVDDHPLVLDGLKFSLHLATDIELVGQAGSGLDAVRLCAKWRPDVILMDVMLPDMDGISATETILQQCPRTKVLILSALSNKDLIQRAIKAGVTGYLLKTIKPLDLIAAIRLAQGGHSTLAPVALQALLRQPPDEVGRDLTQREREVLALLVSGVSNEEMAGRLVLSPSTVRTHISNIFAKLGAANRAEAAALAIKHRLIAE